MRGGIEELRGMFAGETAWIVGKGPSLEFLRAEHFGAGPVIALNQAILIVERLGLNNPLYSLQKDGCGIEGVHAKCRKRDRMDWMIRPQKATLIVQDTPGYSRDCLPDYAPRVAVHTKDDLGFGYPQTMAIRMALAIAKSFGCRDIRLLCCDSLASNNTATFDVHRGRAEQTEAGAHYLGARRHVMNELRGVQYRIFIPKEQA